MAIGKPRRQPQSHICPSCGKNVMMPSPPLEGGSEKAEVTACLGPHGGLRTKPGGERLVVRNSHRLRISEGLGKPTSRWSNGEPITSFFSSKSISQLVHLCSRFPSLALLCSPAEGDLRPARHVTVNSLVAGDMGRKPGGHESANPHPLAEFPSSKTAVTSSL